MSRVLTPSFDDIIKNIEQNKLWDFPGGVFPAQQKELSNNLSIENMSLPERLYIPLKQHIGVEGQLIVNLGDHVLKGQALTRSANPFAVPVHAPTSGTILNIGPHISAHPSALPEQTLVIEPDKLDKWIALSPLQDYQSLPKVAVLEAICNAGVSGMGGAGFPTHIKASPKKDVEFVIINGVECEPYITADDRLMREHAWQIRQGIDVLCHLLSPKQVYIAIEDNKPEAIEAMRVACQQSEHYKVVPIATKYPAGGEKQLIQVMTNREVPKQGLPIDVGVIMHNVGTCYAIADAVFSGKPLIQRVVTVTGQAVQTPKNLWALIGAPVSHLLDLAGYVADKQAQKHIIMGGPMMGFTLASDQVPVVKITNCLLLPTKDEIAEPEAEQPCIRCSACADACPVSLLPQQLFWHSKAKELDKAQDYNLFDCIECGACAYVCPSEIPLVHYYRVAKADIRLEQEEKQKSDKARERFESRAGRLVREQEARDEKHRKAAEARKEAMQNKGGDAQDKIAAALARAKAKKAQQAELTSGEETSLHDTNQTTSEQTSGTSKDDKVAAAIARAKAKKAQKADSDQLGTNTPAASEIASPAAPDENQLAKNDSPGQSKDQRVAAAIARAKAKKAEKSAHVSTTESSTPANLQHSVHLESAAPTSAGRSSVPALSKDQRVAAAIAKAKAKKDQQQIEAHNDEKNTLQVDAPTNNELNEVHSVKPVSKDERVAAAIAKAKAKKAQKLAADETIKASESLTATLSREQADPESDSGQEQAASANQADDIATKKESVSVDTLDPTAQKKARIAVAVAKAKAKAKKLAQQNANTAPTDNIDALPASEPSELSSNEDSNNLPSSEAEQALDEKKRRIAAAVAKAKAKKAAQMKSSEE
ncbi:MAG: electron transport complex subunit RsxC [Paraglaciecola polaris]|uniref:electron transport complex subunit RsxC n=1 Tax=Paraglaciecola polaris TaxID=222814 RepID=UPI003002E006